MSNIVYDEKEEAYRLPYKIWDKPADVLFYAESEARIMEKLSAIAEKLAFLDGRRSSLAEAVISENYYEGGDASALVKQLCVENVKVDLDGDDIVVCFDVDSYDGYMSAPLYVELIDGEFEIVGYAE